MQDILKILKSYIEESGYNLYSFSKQTGINRTTLQKTLAGNRRLTQEFLDSILKHFSLTPSEQKECRDAFLRYQVGEEHFNNRIFVLELLKTDINSFFYSHQMMTEYQPFLSEPEKEPVYMLTSRYSLMKAVEQCIMNRGSGLVKIQTYLEFSKDFYYVLRTMCNSVSEEELCLEHIFMFEKKREKKLEYCYNTRVLSGLLPYLFKNKHNISVRCFYGNVEEICQEGSQFPYYIIIGDVVILVSGDMQKGICMSAPEVVFHYKNEFRDLYEKSETFIRMVTNGLGSVKYEKQNTGRVEQILSIERQPDFISLLSEEILSECMKKTPKPVAGGILLLQTHWQQLESVQGRLLFTKAGLDVFAKTGICYGWYPQHADALCPEHRILVLERILELNHNSEYRHYMMSPNYMEALSSFAITLQDGNHILIHVWNQENVEYYYELHEPSIYETFRDFLMNTELHGMSCTLEETNAYIEELIRKIRNDV